MKKISLYIVSALLFLGGTSSCDYLDIVPDNTQEITTLFETKDRALAALGKCYEYMPNYEKFHNSMIFAGDEMVGRLDAEIANNRGNTRGEKIMRGWQSTSDPILSFWNGGGGVWSLYQGIRYCNIYLENINSVPNMTDEEKADGIAQIKVLKAWYHFYLIRNYGPIIIVDQNIPESAGVEQVRQERKPVDECFQYCVDLIDDVLYIKDAAGNIVGEKTDLEAQRATTFLGQIDRVIAKAIKAKILLYAASPLFNGNVEYYSTFKGIHGEALFNLEYDKEKWKKALDATEEAINEAEKQGKKLYYYEGTPKEFDNKNFYGDNGDGVGASEIIHYCYNNRFSIVESWNSELIWGFSNLDYEGEGSISHSTNMRSTAEPGTPQYAWQWVGANFAMLENFYTNNGVCIDEDRTWDYENRMQTTTIPLDGQDRAPGYVGGVKGATTGYYHKGYLQPGETTVKMHLYREPRFYAWLATDRGKWRTHDKLNDLMMRYYERPGGRRPDNNQTDFYWTGIGIKKLVHPESGTGHWARVVKFAQPIIRLADLYLMYAEAYNEYYGPDQKVYDKLNAIRQRAGLPKVEEVYSDPTIVTSVGKHLDQAGLRQIIQKERQIELAFEAENRYYDILRWKRASEFFTVPVQGWNAQAGGTVETFYVLTTLQAREWQTPRDYLFPIPLTELDKNPNLVQNPGWK